MEHLVKHAALNSLVVAIAGGFFLTLLARRLRVPAIVLLLAGGIALGPQLLGFVQPQSLESVLSAIVSLAVAIILFEGGLTLDLRGYRAGSSAITRLLTLGVVVTWFGAAAAIHFLFGLTIPFSLLGGSLVIVTGPTVIGPLLKRIKIQSRLHSVLHWEAVLIDAIGVFAAVLCFESLMDHDESAVVAHLALRLLSGMAIGALGGTAIVFAFRRKLIPENLQNAFALASAVLIFGLTEAIISEAGLLSVTLAGFIVGWQHPVELKQIRQFKAELTDLLIGLLFILLCSRLQFAQFRDFGWRGLLLVGSILFIVRPLNVLACTTPSSLNWRERIFLCWVAPRGIVAASMASLFAIALSRTNPTAARFMETFTYSIIIATVVLQGFTAGWLARWLNLRRPEPSGWLIVNGDALGRRLAQFIKDCARLDVLVLDTNARLVREAREENLPALCEDALNLELSDEREEFQTVGHLLALTDNSDLNELLCQRWAGPLGRDAVHRWRSSTAGATTRTEAHGRVVFPEMLRPSIIAGELLDGQASLTTVTYEDPPQEIDGMTLLVVRAGAVLPVAEAETEMGFLEGDQLLMLQRSSRHLARSLEAGRVIDLSGETFPQIYEQLLDALVAAAPGVSRPEAARELSDARNLPPPMVGHDVALPHFYSAKVPRRICVVARLRPPLTLGDGAEPVRLIFLLASPAGDPQGHLATLSEIARFCGNEQNRAAFLNFERPEEARRFLRRRAAA